ncbi:MAG: hypothetical protein ABIF08_00760 [Nanoarchaeota archaeon]
MSYLWCIDHDGTASKGDIGRDYLCQMLPGIDSAEDFWEEVIRIRSDADYRNEILRGDSYEEGLELAMLLAYHGVNQDIVRESGRNARNSLRDGFSEFLKNPETGRKIMFSAGPQDWLMNFYMHNFPNINFDVVGTTLHPDENGNYIKIKKPCGRESKPRRIEEVAQFMNGDVCKIGVGDSSGDEKMFEYVSDGGGLTIAIGDRIEGMINLPGDADWHNVVSAAREYLSLGVVAHAD